MLPLLKRQKGEHDFDHGGAIVKKDYPEHGDFS
jgi:hypothetical protein